MSETTQVPARNAYSGRRRRRIDSKKPHNERKFMKNEKSKQKQK